MWLFLLAFFTKKYFAVNCSKTAVKLKNQFLKHRKTTQYQGLSGIKEKSSLVTPTIKGFSIS
jgi:hypothetical protein